MNSFKLSNKATIVPADPKEEPVYINGYQGGYSFRQFLGNVYAHLGELAKVDGIQQLVHHYYLQNGELGARVTAQRIRKLLCD